MKHNAMKTWAKVMEIDISRCFVETRKDDRELHLKLMQWVKLDESRDRGRPPTIGLI